MTVETEVVLENHPKCIRFQITYESCLGQIRKEKKTTQIWTCCLSVALEHLYFNWRVVGPTPESVSSHVALLGYQNVAANSCSVKRPSGLQYRPLTIIIEYLISHQNLTVHFRYVMGAVVVGNSFVGCAVELMKL